MRELVVVSGLPRSGTSLMMRALGAGGVQLVTDEQRPADNHNPHGYFELELVKQLDEDNSWLAQHRGKAIKIIYRLLYHLPTEIPVKILFMDRDLNEVIASQNAMLGLEPDGRDWVSLFEKELERVFRFLQQERLQMLRVSHRRMFEEPFKEMSAVSAFLGKELEVQAMADVVDPELWRRR